MTTVTSLKVLFGLRVEKCSEEVRAEERVRTRVWDQDASAHVEREVSV